METESLSVRSLTPGTVATMFSSRSVFCPERTYSPAAVKVSFSSVPLYSQPLPPPQLMSTPPIFTPTVKVAVVVPPETTAAYG